MLGVDTGGTFTDFVFIKNGRIRIAKRPSTPDNPAQAIVAGVLQADNAGEAVNQVIHGTTVATNAILERKGAKTALITNRGLEHLLLIGRQERPDLYAIHPRLAEPLIPRDLCFGLSVRRNVKGDVLTPLDENEVGELITLLKQKGVEAIVVGFIHAYQFAEDEKRVGALISERWPDVPISLSSEVLPVFREVERLMTSAMNAYVAPKVSAYVSTLNDALASRSLYLMQSNGGTLLPTYAQKQPIRLALSGPAGGVVAAFHLAQEVLHTSQPHILTVDMGGTSTDVALCPGRIPIAQQHEMNEMPMALPAIDIHTVGAGGGSLVAVDSGGAMTVGPHSAGAVPGPVCYGKGGTQLTVTDANLFLGRLQPDWALGTEAGLKPEKARVEALMQQLAQKLDLPTEAVAQGIIDVVDEHMIHALSKVSIQQGFDPKDFALVPFGGAGPLHMCALAEKLGIKTIIVPSCPGVFSALGLVLADHLFDATVTVMSSTREEGLHGKLQRLCDELKTYLEQFFDTAMQPHIEYDWTLQMRYEGQSHEITVSLLSAKQLDEAVFSFHERHLKMNGWQKRAAPQIVTLTGRAVVTTPKSLGQPQREKRPSFEKVISIYEHGWQEVKTVARDQLSSELTGPILVAQEDTTLWINAQWEGRQDKSGALILRRRDPS